ncbi:coatomer subunit alpha [Gonapodya prolifera JEL478]|uniref:Coatomer subunit alpha n=1 Tax=Gonapodya prolifera (strain JEL478) TaxID=1344416 RepID=A0A139AT68_GONPJ|nr:coatomer subunit alpha [Gonapodya prolifera JEL478]|eukprot:KXS19763.1 coatomer subunit alpha [Gonapodya prolifera JEL478]
MLSKFETKSNRVKGLSFHPKRPWILASLHNGSVQLWDYKMGTLIDRFDEHEGPVRGICFHPTQPLFVSGGDDYKVKVWNWKLRRCLFTLNGHLDYIRTVFFHHELPWIISASDDQTIRIWNWQSRNCISILTGHNHYVMCAQFHPKDDLVVSASLDQTVRVWDISGLRKKHAAGPQTSQTEDSAIRSGQQADIFGGTDAVVKYVLEGHDRGVNWASFHPTLPLIVSGADDRQVKLWRMNDTKAWEVDTCRGHYNNVSCVLFHPRQELILSDCEDKTIRVWDMTKRTCLQTFRREHDRFWILAAHPELNLFAAGHDSGLIVFKLERERPAHTIYQSTLLYVRERFVRVYDFSSGNDAAALVIRRGAGHFMNPRTLSYNPAERAVLVCSPVDGGTYELFNLPKDIGGEPRDNTAEAKRGQGHNAVFVARNRFAVLDKQNQQIFIKDLRNEVTKQFKAPANVSDIFYAGTKNILIATPTNVTLYDTEVRSSVAELNVNGVRYVVWSPDMNLVALLSKHTIVVANKQLEQLCLIHETIKIKSGAWDELGIFVYSTLNHIKYALPNGDNGIIRTLEQPIYITRVKGKNVCCLDRDGKVKLISFDPTEYRFKLSLVRKNYEEVLNIIRTSNLVGQAIIAYLQKKGYAEVAMHFVKDPKTRFELAIECGNIDVALECAKVLDREDTWQKLGQEALRQGKQLDLETAYQRAKAFDKLSFLYLITGNVEKLRKMLKIAELRGDAMSRYHNAMFLGDVDEQVRLLREVGQLPLAYLAAKAHGLEDEAHLILQTANVNEDELADVSVTGTLLKTPTPVYRQHDNNWPQLAISKGIFESALSGDERGLGPKMTLDEQAMKEVGGEWGDDLEIPELSEPSAATPFGAPSAQTPMYDAAEEGGWDLDAELDIPDGGLATTTTTDAPQNPGFVNPSAGTPLTDMWARNSNLAADHVAAGSFETAMQLLNRQVGIVNFAPLKPTFLTIFSSSKTYLSGMPCAPAVAFAIHRQHDDDPRRLLPVLPFNLQQVIGKLQDAYAVTTAGRFEDAIATFKGVLHSSLFVVASKRTEVDELQQLIAVSREYILGLRMETSRKRLNMDVAANQKRAIELAAYFTHCQLQPAHLQLSLRSAMTLAFKVRNMNTAGIFARRLLELGPPPQAVQQAKKVQQLCESNPTDEITLDYDQYNPFVICGQTFTPIYRGSPVVACPFCGASYQPDYKGKVCAVCELAQIGASASGLQALPR